MIPILCDLLIFEYEWQLNKEAYMLPNLGLPELIVIFLIVLFLFGAGKIPKIAKDIGGGIREFKKSISGESDKDNENKDEKKS